MPMFSAAKEVQINGGTFNDVGRDQHNTFNNSYEYEFRAGSNPQMHHYQPGARVHHGTVTNIGHAGNLNLGTNYGNLIQNSGGSFNPPPNSGYWGPPMGYDHSDWGYPPHGMPFHRGMPPPWAQSPFTQPPTPQYGDPYPGDDETNSYSQNPQSNNPYRNRVDPRPQARRQDTNPFRANFEFSQSAPSEGGLSYVSEEHEQYTRPQQSSRNQPLNEVDEGMANLRINSKREEGNRSRPSSTRPPGRPTNPRAARCETVASDDEGDEPASNFRNRASDFNLRR